MKLELKKIYKFNFRFEDAKEQEALRIVEEILDDIDYSIRKQDGSLLDFFDEMYSGNILDFIRDLANDPEGRLSENLAEYFGD